MTLPLRIRLAISVGLAVAAWGGVTAGTFVQADEPEVFLNITKSEAEKMPLALYPITGTGVMAIYPGQIEQVLSDDLRRSSFFTVTPAASAGETNPPSAQALQLLKPTGAKGAVWGRVTAVGQDLVLEGHLFDVASGRQMLVKRYLGKADYARYIAHRFADDIVSQLTGERGIAQSRVVYVSDQTGQKELWLMDYDGFHPQRITGNRSLSLTPRWTPDGNWITYLCYQYGNPDICGIDIVHNRRWKLITLSGLNLSPVWSPDGATMALATNHHLDHLEVFLYDRSGKKGQQLTFGLGDNLSPSWSPTGRQLVFVSDRGGTPQLYIMDADGSNVRRLTYQGDYNTSPVWSPKGDWIAYTCRRNGWMRLCLISPDGGSGGILTADGTWNDESPTWSPNGRLLIFTSNRSGRYQFYLIEKDGTNLEPITQSTDNRIMPAWSPQ
ncbi:MAG TPA: Tol-Pal system beta propeller repeat protein TolB [Nitrospiria bacterium]|nr:Tol-Pal system beta propeller repeat protein TolB [Nitrospiria bacterium]